MASTDRRMIAPLMVQHFPIMADTENYKCSSDEWHGFMNEVSELDVPLDEPNGSAFDKWRQALAEKGYPVWPYTPERIAKAKADGTALMVAEEERKAAQPVLLQALAAAAPTRTAEQIIADAKKK